MLGAICLFWLLFWNACGHLPDLGQTEQIAPSIPKQQNLNFMNFMNGQKVHKVHFLSPGFWAAECYELYELNELYERS